MPIYFACAERSQGELESSHWHGYSAPQTGAETCPSSGRRPVINYGRPRMGKLRRFPTAPSQADDPPTLTRPTTKNLK